MSTESEATLAGRFDPPTEDEWLALVDKVLKGAPFSRLRSRTPGGLTVEPLYTRSDVSEGDVAGFPGSAPYVRGARPIDDQGPGWALRSTVSSADPSHANRLALRELERGATELTIRFGSAFRAGLRPSDAEFSARAGVDGVLVTSTDDLATVLDGVLVDVAPVHLQPGSEFARAAQMMITVWERRGVDRADVRGGIGADPIGVLASEGRLANGLDPALAELGALAARLSRSHQLLKVVSVDTTPYVEAGCSEVQELAVMACTGAAYLRSLASEGLDIDQACQQIELTLSADADVFLTIAKLRAARRIWSALTESCGASEESRSAPQHVRTADRMLTRRDPWVNLLRVTAAAFGSGLGGASSVTTAAYDQALGEPDELGRRMARNTQLVLLEESNLGRVTDPAGGSWYVENLTEQIASSAWELFQELESAGGLPTVLLDGTLGERIGAVRRERLERVATRVEPLTGVSEFAEVAESSEVRTGADLRTLRARAIRAATGSSARAQAATATVCEALPRVRWSQEFEALRDASDAYVGATGSRPKVLLVTLGPVAVHTARATFARNLFAAGGIESVMTETGSTTGYTDPADAVDDALRSAAHLVCICSSDEVYAELAVPFAAALRGAGLSPVYLAGRPGEREEAEREAGVSEFIHVGVDVLAALRRAHEVIGTPTGLMIR